MRSRRPLPYDAVMEEDAATAVPPFAGLTPDVVLNAIDAAGLVTTGSLLALNSYGHRSG